MSMRKMPPNVRAAEPTGGELPATPPGQGGDCPDHGPHEGDDCPKCD